jgi:hypothetical protein
MQESGKGQLPVSFMGLFMTFTTQPHYIQPMFFLIAKMMVGLDNPDLPAF